MKVYSINNKLNFSPTWSFESLRMCHSNWVFSIDSTRKRANSKCFQGSACSNYSMKCPIQPEWSAIYFLSPQPGTCYPPRSDWNCKDINVLVCLSWSVEKSWDFFFYYFCIEFTHIKKTLRGLVLEFFLYYFVEKMRSQIYLIYFLSNYISIVMNSKNTEKNYSILKKFIFSIISAITINNSLI